MTNCRYCVSRKIEPNIAKNSSMMPMLAAVKRGFLKKDVSSIGLLQYDSQNANAPSTMIDDPERERGSRARSSRVRVPG